MARRSVKVEVTDANANEKAALEAKLQPNRVYVTDRGYAKYSLLKAMMNIDSSFVCRIRDNAVYETLEDKPNILEYMNRKCQM
jgi:hypothetical protein